MLTWLSRKDRLSKVQSHAIEDSSIRKVSYAFTVFRDQLSQRLSGANQNTAQELGEAERQLNGILEHARGYVENSQRALVRLQGQGNDSLGQILANQSTFLRGHAIEMSDRAEAQDERARQAEAAAKSIADLAASIDRLAGEARLLAVNARIESSRLGAQSAGFDVLASEMQRLSDEVASTNERVGELAERLGQDLPWIAQHARDFRQAMEAFSKTSRLHLEDTEHGVDELRALISGVARSGNTVSEDITTAARLALARLQFQDAAAAQLREIDVVAHKAQLEILQLLGADAEVLAEVPSSEQAVGNDDGHGSQVSLAGGGDLMSS